MARVARTRPDPLLVDHVTLRRRLGPGFGTEARTASPQPKLIALAERDDDEVWWTCSRAGAVGCVTGDRPSAHLLAAIKQADAGEVLFAADRRPGLPHGASVAAAAGPESPIYEPHGDNSATRWR